MTHSLVGMLAYRRPQGSKTQSKFCQRYLEPVFGQPDAHGNYVLQLGESPLLFTAHHDTVHRKEGFQVVTVSGDMATTQDKDSNCLGADCTTGVWLILGMIDAAIPGTYVIHASEESGCVGSRALVCDSPDWLDSIKACISFDRFGQESIITHQCGYRTASDAFAVSLSQALGMPELRPDPTGSYTDSESYAGIVPECTNVSVGYMHQHTSKEYQDLFFADHLLSRLIAADWESLVFERDPAFDDYFMQSRIVWEEYDTQTPNLKAMEEICYNYPEAIAQLLDSYGLNAQDLCEELGLGPSYLTAGL